MTAREAPQQKNKSAAPCLGKAAQSAKGTTKIQPLGCTNRPLRTIEGESGSPQSLTLTGAADGIEDVDEQVNIRDD
jgi:hypothetical protein